MNKTEKFKRFSIAHVRCYNFAIFNSRIERWREKNGIFNATDHRRTAYSSKTDNMTKTCVYSFNFESEFLVIYFVYVQNRCVKYQKGDDNTRCTSNSRKAKFFFSLIGHSSRSLISQKIEKKNAFINSAYRFYSKIGSDETHFQ